MTAHVPVGHVVEIDVNASCTNSPMPKSMRMIDGNGALAGSTQKLVVSTEDGAEYTHHTPALPHAFIVTVALAA